MYREWSPRPSAGGSWKKDVERSRADGTSRERGCPGPGGPRLFSSQWEESGSFYSVPVLRSSARLTVPYSASPSDVP
jgi:hypothetical protein